MTLPDFLIILGAACALLACLASSLLPLAAQQKSAFRAEIRLLAFQPGQAIDEVYAHDPAAADPATAVE